MKRRCVSPPHLEGETIAATSKNPKRPRKNTVVEKETRISGIWYLV